MKYSRIVFYLQVTIFTIVSTLLFGGGLIFATQMSAQLNATCMVSFILVVALLYIWGKVLWKMR
jgi:hypothetical protein